MNRLIETIFSGFTVDNVAIPVKYMYYDGHDLTYIVYMQEDMDNSFSADDDLIAYAEYYDFDIYSKGNYLNVMEAVKELLKSNGFIFQPSRSSSDMYETETGYFHKTLNFAILKEE